MAPHFIIEKLLPYCDVVMGNIWSLESLCAIKNLLEISEENDRTKLQQAGELSIQAMQAKYSNIRSVALTYRFDNLYWAMISYQNDFHVSKIFSPLTVIDKVGSGDCFMAGVIYGIINHWHPKNIVDFAAAAAVGKLAEKGDSTHQTVDQILNRVHE